MDRSKLIFIRLYSKIYRYAILEGRVFEFVDLEWRDSSKLVREVATPVYGRLQKYREDFENHREHADKIELLIKGGN